MIIEIHEGAYADDRYTSKEVKSIMRMLAPALSTLTPLFKLVGSNRRGGKDDYGDIDLLVAGVDLDKVKDVISAIIPVTSVPRQGEKLMSLVVDFNGKSLQLEVSAVQREHFGAAALGATGSNEFNIALRARAKRMGYMLNNYGLFDRETNRMIASKTEKDIFNKLGLTFIPPGKRGVTVSQAYDLFRVFALQNFVDEILDLAVTAMQHSSTIKDDYDKIKDLANGAIDKYKNRRMKGSSTRNSKAAKIRAKRAMKKTAKSVMKKVVKTAGAVKRTYDKVKRRPVNQDMETGKRGNLSTELTSLLESLGH